MSLIGMESDIPGFWADVGEGGTLLFDSLLDERWSFAINDSGA